MKWQVFMVKIMYVVFNTVHVHIKINKRLEVDFNLS